ncbi:MAG: membrane fusion protein (multidrug efflux system) [Crocinitomicaceae bacterium]|jgi:membrane fusion protein (multidrug efflux system)
MTSLTVLKGAVSLSIIIGLFTACDTNTVDSEASASLDKIQTVEVVTPKNRSFTAEVLITGTAEPNQVVTLYAMESGVLTSIRKDIGDKVRKGETIAILSNPELGQQRVKLNAELKGKKSTYERLKSIYEKTPAITSLQTLEDAESAYFTTLASRNAISNRLAFLTIRAPFSGTITQRFVDKGSMLQNGLNQSNPQAIVEIQETNLVRLTLPVPGSDAVAIKKGMDVQVTFPELSGKVISAKISRTAQSLDMQSKTMQVEIDLDNSDGEIITGMYAKAVMQIGSRENILSLPIFSKVRFQNEDYVWVVENNKVRRLPIRIGLADKDYFEVLNAEINKDTQVIIEGKGLVSEGQQVTPILKVEK